MRRIVLDSLDGETMPFTQLGLMPELMRALSASDYVRPTPIQSQAIPVILEGNDLIGTAQTGTGKTAAFVLPLLQRLSKSTGKIRALVLTPTRELAVQVELAVRKYGRFLNLRSTAIYGGVSQRSQEDALKRGVDIVVATPGRLLDLTAQGLLNLSKVEALVLDEADRMLDMGFLPDIRQVVRLLPKERQTLLFSATLPDEIRDLARSVQRNPVRVEVGHRRTPAAGVDQHLFPVSPHLKTDLLLQLLGKEAMDPVLVFTRTKHGADRLHRILEKHRYKVACIHSGRSQTQRQQALDGFRRSHYQILVATDIAARGIDVQNISHVINFDIPNNADDYIHRVGRTGRAEKLGVAYSFVSPEDEVHVQSIERSIQKKLRRITLEGFPYDSPVKPNRAPAGLPKAIDASFAPARRFQTSPEHSAKVFDRFALNLVRPVKKAVGSQADGNRIPARLDANKNRKVTRPYDRIPHRAPGSLGGPTQEEQRELKRLQSRLFGPPSRRQGPYFPRRPASSRMDE
jgi:ATP-dependent RNA helicase RhlE